MHKIMNTVLDLWSNHTNSIMSNITISTDLFNINEK